MGLWKYCLSESVTITVTDPDIVANYSGVNSVIYKDWYTITLAKNYINITVRKGYAWDGCTPKFKVGGKILGIWDGFYNAKTHQPDTYYASLIHDVLCQFYGEHPIQRKDVDSIFLYLLKRDHFLFAYPYYWMVKVFRKPLSRIIKGAK